MIGLLINKNRKHINYSRKHNICFRKLEKQVKGKNTLKGFFHDCDKILLYFLGLPIQKVSYLHKNFFSSHHINNKHRKINYENAVIDWECARFSKPDKPLTARETCEKYFKEHLNIILPICDKFKF